jgi:hypothetical protein
MKKLITTCSLLILSSFQLHGMKCNKNQIMSTPNVASLPNEIIIDIALESSPTTRMSFSLISKLFNNRITFRNEQENILLNPRDRIYYLMYGCLYNLSNLVTHALKLFDSEKFFTRVFLKPTRMALIDIYPDKALLNQAAHWIKDCIKPVNATASNLIPYFQASNVVRQADSHVIIGSFNDRYASPLFFAIDSEDADLFQLLFKFVDNERERANALNYSFEEFKKKPDAIQALSSIIKLSLNTYSEIYNKILRIGLFSQNADLIKILIDYPYININIHMRAEVEKDGTALHHLACGHPDSDTIVRLFFMRPELDINKQDKYGNTILHSIITNILKGALSRVLLLLAHPDIKIDIANKEQETPLTLALKRIRSLKNKECIAECHAIIAQLLLAQGMIGHVDHYTGK